MRCTITHIVAHAKYMVLLGKKTFILHNRTLTRGFHIFGRFATIIIALKLGICYTVYHMEYKV